MSRAAAHDRVRFLAARDDSEPWKHMFIIYRRTGGVLATLTFAAVVLSATVLTAAVAAVVLLVGLSIVATVLLMRAVLPKSWRRHRVPSPTPGPLETIDASVVTPHTLNHTNTAVDMANDKIMHRRSCATEVELSTTAPQALTFVLKHASVPSADSPGSSLSSSSERKFTSR